jgi:hypothetical protein
VMRRAFVFALIAMLVFLLVATMLLDPAAG